ncbi:phospholipase D/nuclease [Zopfia rhizophila CBS 207.26]|uniref:Phospholipase D/nuclease n=1 Tax=Zopfia rhizophila CBS 207.26 TaxID=1314779 RepID=A0A6A6DRG5_9PEZI|nr:phospholipase D/nuclease [Zopfia rhizophila CBS 207.26]
MALEEFGDNPASKRRKLNGSTTDTNTHLATSVDNTTYTSLSRPISPPPARRKRSATPSPFTPPVPTPTPKPIEKKWDEPISYLPSPIQLTRIKELSPAQNVDAVELKDILGDPAIRECWQFNFLFDLDFLMDAFGPDAKNLVQVKVVHGFWRNDDERRIRLQETAERYPNVEIFKAYMPDPFGTHHSKMMILIRHDETAQVIIHTANMIPRDWGNMTQAVWRSPLLPLQPFSSDPSGSQTEPQASPIGIGERFKTDLLRYLKAYGNRLSDLTKQLANYNFFAIRAAFIGSTPSRQKTSATKPSIQTSWGWLGLQEILSTTPIPPLKVPKSAPNIIIQISSIATLGQTPTWLQHFQSVLIRSANTPSSTTASPSKVANFFAKQETGLKAAEPKFNIIFPTAHEIRTSLDGYASGASIHTKIQSAAQQKQLQYLSPLLCHWRSDNLPNGKPPENNSRKAERGSAAPHIKTYIRFSDESRRRIDWAMVTSANLSQQAWGALENKEGEVRIQSWETGVVFWPELFRRGDEEMVMVPVFERDLPGANDEEAKEGDVGESVGNAEGNANIGAKKRKTVVGLRMPYDLPLVPYAKDEVPWCASADHEEPDWMGRVWKGHQPHG